MKRIPLKERVAVMLLLAMLVTNPLTGQYVLLGLEWVFQQMFLYGAWISIVATVYLIGLGAAYYYRIQHINIPKAKKSKTPAYIET